ncbi:MAG TPA: Bax inhibitor-1/YccA family protein [Candidatus Limnocylindrales bacterium]|nr:Bax inhibitor-1/YccA family protein [Candidatus Limnocylindrales bacterium]
MSFQNVPGSTGPGYGAPGDNRGVVINGQAQVAVQGAFLTQAFFWMFAGLLVTAAIATFAQANDALLTFAARNFLVLIIAQLALAIGIQWGIRRINATLALGLFFVYAASLGLTMGLIVSLYTQESVAAAFLSASAMFGGAALYGYTTKRSLASMGGFLSMGVLGLIVAMVVNVFLASGPLGFIISIIGVVIFTGLTAWDVQRIQAGNLVQATGSVEKAAVIGALHLYLDFVNLFLFLLRIFGGGRR